MKRFSFLLIALILSFGASLAGVSAQDATPEASPTESESLLAGLGYPVIEYTTDGTALSGPAELKAGRYLMQYVNNSDVPESDISFYAPVEGETADQLIAAIAALDPASDEAPEWYFSIPMAGGTVPGTDTILQLTPGEWVATAFLYGEESVETFTQKVTVTGELPEYPAIAGAVEVTLADLSIDLPDTLSAGPQIWQVTNTGAMPHFVYVMNPGGELTNEDAVNGVKLFYGMADATPAAEGSAQDPSTWQDVSGSQSITNGVTTFIEIDLEPGTYIAFCFIEGPGELGSHALHGMTQVFTVE